MTHQTTNKKKMTKEGEIFFLLETTKGKKARSHPVGNLLVPCLSNHAISSAPKLFCHEHKIMGWGGMGEGGDEDEVCEE